MSRLKAASKDAGTSAGGLTQAALDSSLEKMQAMMMDKMKERLDALAEKIDKDREEDANEDEATAGVGSSLHKSWCEFTGAASHDADSTYGKIYQASWSFVVLIVVASYTGG